MNRNLMKGIPILSGSNIVFVGIYNALPKDNSLIIIFKRIWSLKSSIVFIMDQRSLANCTWLQYLFDSLMRRRPVAREFVQELISLLEKARKDRRD